jgi:hypothetical protein
MLGKSNFKNTRILSAAWNLLRISLLIVSSCWDRKLSSKLKLYALDYVVNSLFCADGTVVNVLNTDRIDLLVFRYFLFISIAQDSCSEWHR